jgi:signal transduction histidine kinase
LNSCEQAIPLQFAGSSGGDFPGSVSTTLRVALQVRLSKRRLTPSHNTQLASAAKLLDAYLQSERRNATSLEERSMRETEALVTITEPREIFGKARTAKRPTTWSLTAKIAPQGSSEFESVLLAIAGHDLRQPLQVIQGAHDFLGLGVRTETELRLLQSGQSAIDRLKDQLDQLFAAI